MCAHAVLFGSAGGAPGCRCGRKPVRTAPAGAQRRERCGGPACPAAGKCNAQHMSHRGFLTDTVEGGLKMCRSRFMVRYMTARRFSLASRLQCFDGCSPAALAGTRRHPAHRHPGTDHTSCPAPPQQPRQHDDRLPAWRAPRCRTPAERRAADQECSRRWRLISSSMHVDDPAIESTTPRCNRVTTVQAECLAVEPR